VLADEAEEKLGFEDRPGEEYDRQGGVGTKGGEVVEKLDRAEYSIRISSAEALSIGFKVVVPFMIPSMIFLESTAFIMSRSSMSSEALLTG